MHKDTILPHQDWLGSKDQKWFRVRVTAGRKFTNQNLYGPLYVSVLAEKHQGRAGFTVQ